MPAHELRIPDGAAQGPHADEAVELMRAFWVHDRPEYTLSTALTDPRNIGRMLYEAAFHFSQVYASRDLGQADELLKQITEGWTSATEIQMATRMSGGEQPADDGKA